MTERGVDPALPLLAIETAGSTCSAAVARGGEVIARECRPMRHGHAEALLPMIDRVMAAAGLRPAQLRAIAVTIGPGGFTGIRVGLAAARGIALATGARLIGVSNFAAVAAALSPHAAAGAMPLLVALDSRRAEYYVQLFAADRNAPLGPPAAVLPGRLADYVASAIGEALIVGGDAAAAAAAALGGRPDLTVMADAVPDALGVAAAALCELRSGTASGPITPLYLRPPDVSLPKSRPLPAPVASG